MKDKIVAIRNVISSNYVVFICISLLLMTIANFYFTPKVLGDLLRGVTFFLLIFYTISNFKNFKRIKLYNLIILTGYLIISFVSIFTANKRNEYSFTTSEMLQSIVQVLGNAVFIFTIFTTDWICGERKLKIISISIISIVTIFVLFSIFLDLKIIDRLSQGLTQENSNFRSVFKGKNFLGYYLLLGSIVSCINIIKFKKKIFLIPLFGFLIYSLFIRTKTSFILIFILLIFVFFKFLLNLKKDNVFFFIVVSITVAIITSSILFIFEVGFFKDISYYVLRAEGTFIEGMITFGARIRNFGETAKVLKDPSIVFLGIGERFTYRVIRHPIDNAFLFSLVTGGVYSLFMIIYCYIYVIRKVVTKKFLVFPFLTICITILYCFVENFSPFSFNYIPLSMFTGFLLSYVAFNSKNISANF